MPPKSEEPPMDSKFEFWTDLPNEMRAECIKRMDFKSKMQLRGASKQDKLLVESVPKYQFNSVVVNLLSLYMPSVTCEKSGQSELKIEHKLMSKVTPEFLQKAWQLVRHILKFSNAETIDFASNFKTDEAVSKFLADISDSTPFHFKSITLDCRKFEIIDFFLKNCNSLESIYLESSEHLFGEAKMTELVNFPSVINAKIVQIDNLTSRHVPYQFITKWINKKELDMGKTLQIRSSDTRTVRFLAATCNKHVVSKTVKTLRLRTNDSTKHILIREIPDVDIAFIQEGLAYFSFLVIPAEQKESEYEKNDQWAHDAYRKDIDKNMDQLGFALNDI